MNTPCDKNDLEERIIRVARSLFIERGFAETSMSDIAATVGINRPVLHYYFRTKSRMFQAVFYVPICSLSACKRLPFGTPNTAFGFTDGNMIARHTPPAPYQKCTLHDKTA